MIKGKTRKEKIFIRKEDILERISTYDIYRYYIGPFTINKPCINKYRGEKNPSLIIGNKISPDLTHKDFGDYSWRGDAFSLVMRIHNCDFQTALRIIDRDFNLGIAKGEKCNKKPEVITWSNPKTERRDPPLIQIVYYSKMSKRGLDYWSGYEQGEEDLKRERIFQPREIWRNRKRIDIGDLLTFAYYYEDIDRWKIYRPFAPRRTRNTPVNQWKWDSNVPFNYVDNLSSIKEGCKRAFITKSKKDRMVLMKVLETECIVDVQAEDPACVSQELIELYSSIPERYIVSDNDKKGKEFSWWLTREHGFRHINVPDSYLNQEPKCTDFSDMCFHYGIERVRDYFRQKKIIM